MNGLPGRCAVIGGGRMGAGVAHALLLAGSSVTVVERDDAEASVARSRVERAVTASARRGQVSDPGEVLARLDPVAGTAGAGLAGAGLVIEAVPEDVDLKLAALRAVEEAVPVPASRLVEVVMAAATAPELRDRAAGWVSALGKTAVVVRDVPGFASSRLGVALGLEAIRMVEAGVASPEDIDAAMSLGYGHPTGPLRLVERGHLGRKTGRGFYDWTEEAAP